MIKSLLISLFLLLSIEGFTQISPDHYLIEFSNKDQSPYSLDHPEAFLSAKAIARRAKFQIPVTSEDFPVNPQYIQAVRDIGIKYVQQCKWINSIVIRTADSAKLALIAALPFVKKLTKNNQSLQQKDEPVITDPVNLRNPGVGSAYDYGEAYSQISMVSGITLHDEGFLGKGISIAVLDGGFSGTNLMHAFDSLRANSQIKGTLNLVGGGSYVYQGTSHGSNVLSILASNIPGMMVGTAPKADYYLIRTEDINGESLLEEYNWMTGAAFADSAGVDIISSSLSYAISSSPATGLTYEQLDGNTAPVTIAAETAMRKGMVVVVSAGNNGENQSWPYLGFPADGDSAFAVGAVDAHGIRAPFSSPGPTYDGRIKPDVMAMGVGTIVMKPDGTLGSGDGTSFATPIIAGLTACLWQAYPEKSNMEILSAIRMSGNHHPAPNNLMGDGVPDFSKAAVMLKVNEKSLNPGSVAIHPNPFTTEINVGNLPPSVFKIDVEILDPESNIVFRQDHVPVSPGSTVTLQNLSRLSEGFYLLKIITTNSVYVKKIMKIL